MSVLTNEARKRLKAIEEFSDLGSGFNIAMRDLDIRGAGNLLGAEQSGFIADIGYETYQKILEEAVQELKEQDFKDLFREQLEREQKYVQDVQIDTDTEMHIPDEYVSSIEERLRLYTELDRLENEADIEAFTVGLVDRFGAMPPAVEELFDGLRIRWVARALGFDRLSLKNHVLRCYFHKNAQSAYYESPLFTRLVQLLSTNGKVLGIQLKQTPARLLLIKEKVGTLRQAREFLVRLQEQAQPETA